MNNERYPQDLVISLKDFETSGWKECISLATREGYSAMWTALSAAARSAIEQSRAAHGKVLWLLADACSMTLSPSSPNEPFKPYFVYHDRRSVVPDDLLNTDISFFAEIVDVIDDNWLKARISDVLWIKGSPRNTAYALQAIDAYRCLQLVTKTWIHGGSECWERAFSLTLMLRNGAGERLQQMEMSIIVAFNATTRADDFFALWLAELLQKYRLGRAHRIDIAKKLEKLAHEFNAEGDLRRAREYFSVATKWHKAIPDDAKAAEMTVAVAEIWVKEAIAHTAFENPRYMLAAGFYENAIQTYRMIPRSARAVNQVEERISELRNSLNHAGELGLNEMVKIKSPSVNINHFVDNARKLVTGKLVRDALFEFSNLFGGVNIEELRNSALERMRKYPLQAMLASTVISRDGRIIAKRPGLKIGTALTAEDEIAIHAEMIRDYGTLVNIVVQGDIWPALEVLLLEHRLREVDFVELAKNSSIVPKDRTGLFGKALFAGYERDFVTALHLLIPQIENMVRYHLKQVGAKTTNIDKDGIQNENGLSTLLELPEAVQVFGKEIVFELNALFCNAIGPNLRNELAHGLLEEDDCNSPFAIYAWWLVFRLTFNTWWNTAHPATSKKAANEKQDATSESVTEQGEH